MAKCDVCGKEMLEAKGCVGPDVRIDGKMYKRIRMGAKGDMSARYGGLDSKAKCGDCGCRMGGLHHWGCDMETCPKCGEQLISCACENVDLIVKQRVKAG